MTAEGEDRVEKPFQCDLCVMEFTFKNSLQRHIDRKHSGQFQCQTCLRNVSSAENLKLHQCPKYPCYLCEEKYSHAKTLKRHQKLVHFGERKLIFCCYFCQMEFSRKHHLRHHKCIHAPNRLLIRSSAVRKIKKKYQCDICKVVIVGKRSWRRHIASHRAMESKAMESLHCDLCQKTFYRKDHLKMHIKAHRGSFKCNICLKNYYRLDYLKRHRCVNRRKLILLFTCDQCEAAYKHKGSLLNHQREVHPSVSTLYCCDLCELEFARKSKLRRHQRNHPENIQFKRSTYSANLRNHQSIEAPDSVAIQAACADTDEKSFQCEDCETKFATNEDLQRHIEKHLKLTQWHLCPKRSECKHSFKYHLTNHIL